MKVRITTKQQQKLLELEKWFDFELAKLRKRQLDILQRYDKKKSLLLQKKLLQKIIDIKN